ncbi:MAG: ArdC-like ssDNA-binding domain-containing protein [Propionibacteriaceae bacterium]|nr:ArdC-like ssDNA-binding domain-containing protein [Propionibacteriaceae bacterium]
MTKRIKSKKTTEQHRAEAQALQESIASQVENLRNSEQWQRYLDFARSFHAYSVNNVLLILSQCPHATMVAGFRQWQAKNRQVRKGEKALKIFGFAQRKVDADEQTQDAEEPQKVTYFPKLSVFDISQTDIIDPTIEDASSPAQRLTGDDELGICEAVAQWLRAQGWAFSRQSIPGETNGYTTMDGSRRVVVEERLSEAQTAKTALHEAAHVILHSDDAPGEYVEHRGLKETEAESVAYVVAGLLGLDTTGYSIGYVAGWSAGDAELIKSTAGRVLRASHILIEALTESGPQE